MSGHRPERTEGDVAPRAAGGGSRVPAGAPRETGRLVIDPTGVTGLDEVLGGGLPRGTLVSVVGPPGSGKTVLVTQLAFAAARAGRRVLVFTMLSESTDKIIAHLRGFRFFDEDLVGGAVQFLSMQASLTKGVKAAGEEIVAVARQARADLVIVDGFSGVRGADANPQVARQLLYDLGTTLGAFGVTLLVSGEANPRDATLYSELTTSDIILGLHYGLEGVRQRRGIEVIKLRGAAPLPGLHALRIDAAGVVVYPRLEARIAARVNTAPPSSQERPTRASVGFAELDTLLDGGFTRGTSTLVAGSFGSGKTLLALTFLLTGVRGGEPALFLGFHETEALLRYKASMFALGPDLEAALAPGGGLTLLRYAPVELQADVVADHLIETLDRTGARRVAVDSIVELERAARWESGPARTIEFLGAVVEALRLRGVTALFTKEISKLVGVELDFADTPISVLAENVLLLRQVEYRARFHRVLSVLKMRYSAYDASVREYTIASPEGIRVLAPSQSVDGILTGIARGQGSPQAGTPQRGNAGQANPGQANPGQANPGQANPERPTRGPEKRTPGRRSPRRAGGEPGRQTGQTDPTSEQTGESS